jgi:hypothetical protein
MNENAHKLAMILSLLQIRASGERLSQEEIRAAIGATKQRRGALRGTARGVALLPVFGVLGQRMNLPLAMSGGTSMEMLASEFRQLRDDDRVLAIVPVLARFSAWMNWRPGSVRHAARNRSSRWSVLSVRRRACGSPRNAIASCARRAAMSARSA